MLYFRYHFLLLQFIFSLFAYTAYSKGTLNPKEYGLDKAKDDIERYYILLQCHQDAVKYGKSISYKGINDIHIEIPSDAVTIPLTETVDFCNVNLYVRNTSKKIALFALRNELNSLSSLDGEDIDDANFTKYSEINRGTFLLVIDDETPWVKNRKGYDYGANRRDVMLVVDGKGINTTIASYRTKASKPKGRYVAVSRYNKTIKNLHFYRTNDSLEMTFLCSIQNQYNIRLENISITTPDDNNKFGDAVIRISNSVDVTLNNIEINGTYSQLKKFGYGLGLNNLYNLKVNRMYARAKWGVFGTNNMNTVTLKDCDINRFDIHCYGRDIKAVNCKFSGLYNQFSSVFGTVTFKKCEFSDFIPVLMEPSYNAYSPFDIVWKNCVFNLTKRRNFLFTLSGLTEEYNLRPELNRKCFPNITMKNCKVNIEDGIKKWYLIQTGKVGYKESLDYASFITMKNIKTVGNTNAVFEISTQELKLTNPIKTTVKIR